MQNIPASREPKDDGDVDDDDGLEICTSTCYGIYLYFLIFCNYYFWKIRDISGYEESINTKGKIELFSSNHAILLLHRGTGFDQLMRHILPYVNRSCTM